MKYLIAILVCLSFAAHSLTQKSLQAPPSNVVEEWVEFRDEAGLFSLSHPKHWEVATKGDFMEGYMVNMYSKESAGSVTVLAYIAKSLPADFTRQWLQDSFSKERSLSAIEPVSINNWQGYRQLFRGDDEGGERDWIVMTAKLGNTYVLISANDKTENMKVLKEIYKKILLSLMLYQAKQP